MIKYNVKQQLMEVAFNHKTIQERNRIYTTWWTTPSRKIYLTHAKCKKLRIEGQSLITVLQQQIIAKALEICIHVVYMKYKASQKISHLSMLQYSYCIHYNINSTKQILAGFILNAKHFHYKIEVLYIFRWVDLRRAVLPMNKA